MVLYDVTDAEVDAQINGSFCGDVGFQFQDVVEDERGDRETEKRNDDTKTQGKAHEGVNDF